MTKAEQLAIEYANKQGADPQGIAFKNPATNPAWQNRARVPSPPRLHNAPSVSEATAFDPATDGEVVPSFRINSPPPGTQKLYRTPELEATPTFQALTRLGDPDDQVIKVVQQVQNQLEVQQDVAERCFRFALNNKTHQLLIPGQIQTDVMKQLTDTFFLILSREEWLFSVVRFLQALRPDQTGPGIFKSICFLAANHAVLAYADVVLPFSRLEEFAVEDEPGASEEAEDFDAALGDTLHGGQEGAEDLKSAIPLDEGTRTLVFDPEPQRGLEELPGTQNRSDALPQRKRGRPRKQKEST